jgi:FKBP-type peptidyl-prolyl cis-trans isomerase 2
MQNGDFVRIDYIGRLESGEIFDLTYEDVAKENNIYNPDMKYKSIPIIIGAGFIIPGLEKALLDMKPGEKKEVVIKPEDGFGQRDPKLVRIMPTKIFERQKFDPEPGMILDMGGMTGKIQSVNAGRVRIDFNNPLAGKTLKYELELKEKIEGQEKQIDAVLEYFAIDGKINIVEKTVDIETDKISERSKKSVSELVTKYVSGVEKVRIIETFSSSSAQ